MVLLLARRLQRAVALALPAVGLHRIRKHTPITARQCAVSELRHLQCDATLARNTFRNATLARHTLETVTYNTSHALPRF